MQTIALLQSFATPWLDALMLAATHLGAVDSYIVLLSVIYLAVDARVGRDIGVTLLVSYYLNQGLKGLFDTPRPFELHPQLLRSPYAEATAPGPGFPSGHAQAAATFWPMWAAWASRPAAVALAVVMVGLIGGSRVYLGVHLPVDVWGGLVLGLAMAALGWAVLRRRPDLPAWTLYLGLLAPLALHLTLPTEDSGMIAGGIAGFLLAGVLVPHRPRGAAWRRGLVALLGLTLVFGWLAVTSAALPEAVKEHALVSYLRYLLLALLGLAAAPWLGRRTGLVPAPS